MWAKQIIHKVDRVFTAVMPMLFLIALDIFKTLKSQAKKISRFLYCFPGSGPFKRHIPGRETEGALLPSFVIPKDRTEPRLHADTIPLPYPLQLHPPHMELPSSYHRGVYRKQNTVLTVRLIDEADHESK